MTTTTQFLLYGASDDLIEVESIDTPGVSDEFDVYGRPGTVRISDPASGQYMDVTLEFTSREWEVRVMSSNEDLAPPWPIQFVPRPDRADDPAVIVTAPAGATFALVQE